MGRRRAALEPTTGAWWWLVVILAGMALLNGSVLWHSRVQIRGGLNDFMHLYAAGQMTRQGEGARLFDEQRQREVQHELSGLARVTGTYYPYLRPPFGALIFVPFTYFPLFTAYLLWTVMNLLILAAIVRLVRSRAPALGQLPRAIWFVAPPAFFPIIVVLGQGQDVLLLLLLFTLACLALSAGRELSAGVWLGLALFRPQFTLPLLAVLACSRRWGVLRGAALVASGWGLLTAAVFGWTMLLEYPRHLWQSEQALNQTGSLLDQMPSIQGLVSVLLRPAADRTILVSVVLLSAVVFFWAARFYRRHRLQSPDMAFSAALVASILVSYHAYDHSLSLLFLPLLLQLNWLLTNPHRRITAWLLMLPILPLFLSPLGILMLRHGGFHLYPLALLVWFAGAAAAVADSARTGA